MQGCNDLFMESSYKIYGLGLGSKFSLWALCSVMVPPSSILCSFNQAAASVA